MIETLPSDAYDFYDPPIPIEIEGSLFFNVGPFDGPRPGPWIYREKIKTLWEIRPITRIVFEPG
jgi:hypothetical protein